MIDGQIMWIDIDIGVDMVRYGLDIYIWIDRYGEIDN